MVASISYAAAVKVSTTSIAIQTDLTWPRMNECMFNDTPNTKLNRLLGVKQMVLTWPNTQDKLKNISDLKKTKKQAPNAAQNQQAKSTQVSLD